MINSDFYQDIERKTIDAIFQDGYRKILVWGFNETTVFLLKALSNMQIENNIVAIVDSNNTAWGQKVSGLSVSSPETINEYEIDCLVITCDKEKEDILREYISVDQRTPKIIISGIAHMDFTNHDFKTITESCIVKSYAGGYNYSQIHLFQCIQYIIKNNLKGNVAEFGMFKGGTLLFIFKIFEYYKYSGIKSFFGFDTFLGFPPRRSLLDAYSQSSCEFKNYNDIMAMYQNKFRVIQGDIVETFKIIEDEPLVFTFFDTDNYSPTHAAIDQIYSNTLKGGIIAFDHYYTDKKYIDTIGERMAAKEFLMNKNVFHLHGTGIFIKMED